MAFDDLSGRLLSTKQAGFLRFAQPVCFDVCFIKETQLLLSIMVIMLNLHQIHTFKSNFNDEEKLMFHLM